MAVITRSGVPGIDCISGWLPRLVRPLPLQPMPVLLAASILLLVFRRHVDSLFEAKTLLASAHGFSGHLARGIWSAVPVLLVGTLLMVLGRLAVSGLLRRLVEKAIRKHATDVVFVGRSESVAPVLRNGFRDTVTDFVFPAGISGRLYAPLLAALFLGTCLVASSLLIPSVGTGLYAPAGNFLVGVVVLSWALRAWLGAPFEWGYVESANGRLTIQTLLSKASFSRETSRLFIYPGHVSSGVAVVAFADRKGTFRSLTILQDSLPVLIKLWRQT